MKRETIEVLNGARFADRAMVRAIDLASGDEQLIDVATAGNSLLEKAAVEAARADRSGAFEDEGRKWFLAVYNPPLDLVIVGAVHIAQVLAQIASLAGYEIRIIDPRTAFATADRFPNVRLTHDWPDEALKKIPLGPRSAIVALTHDPKIDDPALTVALNSGCFYIGALGSKKTHAARLARLKSHGFSEVQLARIHGPIGLNIGGKTPAEIAISILAEITMRLRTDGAWEHNAARATA